MGKLFKLARSDGYWSRVAALQAKQSQNYSNAREIISANRVTHLEQLIAVERKAPGANALSRVFQGPATAIQR